MIEREALRVWRSAVRVVLLHEGIGRRQVVAIPRAYRREGPVVLGGILCVKGMVRVFGGGKT